MTAAGAPGAGGPGATPPSPALAALADELERAREHLRRLAGPLDEARWAARPAPGRWSVAECVDHLATTSEFYLPRLRRAVAGVAPEAGGRPLRRDLVGRLFVWLMEPPVRARLRAPRKFLPGDPPPRDATLARFDRLQDDLVALIRAADGLPIDRVKVSSPASRRVRFSLLSAFAVLAAHQRHLWQAERVVTPLGAADNPEPPAT
jgi:hypothetical protein